MNKRPLISVIIPTHRSLDCLRLSVPAFLACPDCEVVVGLDGDSAACRAYLGTLPIRVCATRRRQGACTATNLAAAAATGEYFFLCNDDMVPAPGWDAAVRELARPERIVSGWCWEPGLIEAPPCHARRDFGRDPAHFREGEFFEAVRREAAQAGADEPGINYPFLIAKELWNKSGGLDERFNPGSASDPDLFIRLRLLDPEPGMIRAKRAVFYHFASRSSSFAGGKIALNWKFHRRHGRYMFRRKWGRMWEHAFGEVPDISGWRAITARPEPLLGGRLWRYLWFGGPGRHTVSHRAGDR
ncbi:MAG: glycosyltransferase [Candidatus Edwardsbacteria bacterium]|nr:glycosyltransferase [Candidatus Edwardsbacteria bacterium]